jgi:nucleotide-binding universal stress UspA family protein
VPAVTKTIVVAVDGSESCLKGVRHAAQLARELNAKLELAYVSPPVLLPPSVYAETIQKIEEAEDTHAKDVLDVGAKAAGIECVRVHLRGAAAEALSDYVKSDERFWGVVIGAKGHNALSRVMLGSVTDRLVHICPKPVLIVR